MSVSQDVALSMPKGGQSHTKVKFQASILIRNGSQHPNAVKDHCLLPLGIVIPSLVMKSQEAAEPTENKWTDRQFPKRYSRHIPREMVLYCKYSHGFELNVNSVSQTLRLSMKDKQSARFSL